MATQTKIGWRPYVGVLSPLLDTYTGYSAAYSLRKLKSTYTGSAIRVRRSSDNTEQNIGFNTDGGLDTTALTTFIGSGNGFVTTWYDQSGLGKNAVQSTAANQPQIVNNGVVYNINNKPSIYFNGTKLLETSSPVLSTGNSPYSIHGVSYNVGSVSSTLFYIGDATSNNGVGLQVISGGSLRHFWYNREFTSYASSINFQNYYGVSFDGTNVYTSRNTTTTFIGTGTKTTSNPVLIIGKMRNWSEFYNGYQQELVIFNEYNNTTTQEGIRNNINTHYSIWDNDAEAFITATGLSSTGYVNSIRTLVATLKSANIWSKLKAVYPFVGGTANTHKFNLKDPRDLDAAYRLNFYGGWTHYASGPFGNGSNSYADTNLNPFLKLTTNSSSIGIWTPNGMANHGFGVWSNSGANRFAITEYGGGYVDSQMTSPSTRAWGITYTTSGFIMGSRTSATSNKIYRFGSLIPVHPSYGGVPYNTTANTVDYPNANFWLGRVNGNTSINYYNNSLYFAYIADGLTDAEILALSNAAYTFRQSIGHY